ncbi:MAG: zinc ribbon domain-containing protein [Lachnospiraceae bacterium]|nr:zinc ribbon domain-containing protein [Lachnospiraceae bacterium]
MKQEKTNTCPHCNKPVTTEDVCPHCGHIINEEVIKSIPSLKAKNAKPNVFVVAIMILFAAISTGFSVVELVAFVLKQKQLEEIVSSIPTMIVAIILIVALIFIFVRYLSTKKGGKQYEGRVYGYMDDDYEGDNQTREQTCYIVYLKDEKQYSLTQSYNLGHSRIFDINDRPYIPGTKVNIFINNNCYVCEVSQN